MKHDNLIDNLTFFPHVASKIRTFWGTERCREYLADIMRQSDRPNRQGFPPYVFRTLFDLYELHDIEYPEFRPRPSPWDHY